MFISLVGPPLMQFNPLPYVKKWLAHGHSAERNRLSHMSFQTLLPLKANAQFGTFMQCELA